VSAQVVVQLMARHEAGSDAARHRLKLALADQCANLFLGAAKLESDLGDRERRGPGHARSISLDLVPTYTVKPLDPSTWDAFAALVEANNGVFGGCWCIGFHDETGSGAALHRRQKLARVREGTTHAALVFDGDDCVGWCQFGSPSELPRIKSRREYEKGVEELPDWRIACNFVGKGHRRQGVAAAALAGALDLIARLGGGTVEGYPEDAGSVPAGFLFNGALSTYEKLGFSRDRKIGKHRWVVTKVIEPKR
jgi:GNAT superfamily N-acetyltransferase